MTLAAWEAEERCFAIVTDNGANFAKAARLATVGDDLRCACHTLQLALKDGVASEPLLKQLCLDAQQVVRVIRHSHLLTAELEEIQLDEKAAAEADEAEGGDETDIGRPLKLALNVPTRFNSLHILFSRLLDVKSSVQRLCISQARQFEEKALSTEQWEQMAELVAVLAPVKALCTTLETSASPSLSLFIPLTCKLMDVLLKLTDGASPKLKIPCCRALCEKVRLSIYTRMTTALCDPPCMLAMMLDPRVRTKEIKNYNKAMAEKLLRDTFVEFPSTLAKFEVPNRHDCGTAQYRGRR